MTTGSATPAQTLAASFGSPDPVRSRVKFDQPLTNYEKQHPFIFEETRAKTFRIPLPTFKLPKAPVKAPSANTNQLAETDHPRRPHPGDIFYWVTCLGGVCLLLLASTR